MYEKDSGSAGIPHKEESKEDLRKQTELTLYVAAGIGSGLLLLYWFWFYLVKGVPLAIDAGAWGTFGDFVGGIMNPIVAGCALYWLTRSIQIQRDELSATKLELAASRAAQQDQAKTLEKQRFEDTFFALLDQHNNVLKTLNDPLGKNDGLSMAQSFHKSSIKMGLTLGEAKIYLEQHDDECGHYFRILYQLLKLIAIRSPGSEMSVEMVADDLLNLPVRDEEKLYSNIVRSFLNVDITQLLAINCYCEAESTYWKYKCLIERYEFLEHMPFEREQRIYFPIQQSGGFYEMRAFGKSDYLAVLF